MAAQTKTTKDAPRRAGDDARRSYRRYESAEDRDPGGPPDVLLDVPELRLDSLHFELDDLDAHVAVKARVLDLVRLNVGVDVHLSRVKLDVKGVEAEIVLKARLEHVTAIVDRLMTSLDRNPELVQGLSRAVSQVGEGAGEAVGKTGEAAKDVGAGAQSALQDVGHGAGEAVGDVGQGAGQAVGGLGKVVGGLGRRLEEGDGNGAAAGMKAKEMAREVARELGHAASGEARDLGLAATRKVRELSERREQRRAERHQATEAAVRLSDELGVDLTEIEGTGADGRITVQDVRAAQEA
jgi:hypothetical protein